MKLRLYLDIAPWMLAPSAVWSFNAYSHPPVKGEDVVRYAIDVEVPDPNQPDAVLPAKIEEEK